ncbi:MAG: imidazole glycerol phosphate synthase subunit HisH [Clostridia bacterium]|nr:imidazole glycerol phosphate synthase subunit HisH [Clostridia bacterium]
MVAIVDYGVGNLFSVKSSFAAIGAEAVVTDNAKVLEAADCILLPGVGAFEDAIKKLHDSGLDTVLKQLASSGKPLMGICLGMQLLFEKSYEYGIHQGLGLIKGEVRPIRDVAPVNLKVPHIGWNALDIKRDSPLLKNVKSGDCVYFVHSYYATDCEESVIATTEYGAPITAAVQSGNIMGCQFHPEKSGEVGLSILRAFVQIGENKL